MKPDAPRPQWRPLPEVWREFAQAHPELYLGEAPSTRSRFVSRHGDALTRAGVLIRARGTTYVNDKFVPMALALTLGIAPEPAEASA